MTVELDSLNTSWVGDAWLPAKGEPQFRENPANRADRIGPYFGASAGDVRRAIEAALAVQKQWGETPAPIRGQIVSRAGGILRREADAVANALTREEGKTLSEARAEVAGAAAILEASGSGAWWNLAGRVVEATRPGVRVYTRLSPLGLVGVLTPWNFPCSNPSIKLAASIVAGNSVVWKPASWTPATSLALTMCFVEAGLPSGVLNTVLGPGDRIGDLICGDPSVRAISFTGSTEVGKILAVRLAERGARAQLEMGGKNAIVVLDDADIPAAARATALSAFLSAGQKCTAASRVITVKAISSEFQEALVEETRRLRIGNPMDPETDIGPVIHQRQLDMHVEAISQAKHAGARILVGGGRVEELPEGNYLAPTVLDTVSPDAQVAQQELFGPVLAMFESKDYTEAVRLANASHYGLTASIYTRDLYLAEQFAHDSQDGVVKINEPPPGIDPHVPTGGWKDSGYGWRELGPDGLKFFCDEKTIYVSAKARM
jgi:acyl-CoA reductase-like NAD-dependent aldehyde dehydrogenase